MTLERLMRKLEPRQKLFISNLALGTVIGCASGSNIPDETESQGGAAGADQNGGAVGSSGMAGNGGSEEKCSPNASFTCHNGDAYWQNSCGEVGELYQTCSQKQVCENGTCVYDCSMTTPTSGCTEQNCAFYDTFDYDTCKWDIKAGMPTVSNEKLYLLGNALVETKDPAPNDSFGPLALSPACNGDFIARYMAELDTNTQGSVKISHRNQNPNYSGLILIHFQFGLGNNKVALECNGIQAVVENIDLHSQKRLEVHKTSNRLELYVDGTFTSSVLCNETGVPTPVYFMMIAAGSAVLPQAMKIDDVTLYCSN